MTRQLLRREGLALMIVLAGCGGAARSSDVGVTPRPAVLITDWPPLATDAGESMTVDAALRAVDGAQIRVRAYLVALSAPCPACNVVGQHGASGNDARIGKTARSRGPEMPGCAPCLPAAATFSDEPPAAAPGSGYAPLRAVGGAEALQARHVGHVFLLTGTFHARGEQGPELEVSDVRAVASTLPFSGPTR